MAKAKDRVVVVVIGGLTSSQANRMTDKILTAKEKYAPYGKGTIASVSKSDVGKMLQRGMQKQLEGK